MIGLPRFLPRMENKDHKRRRDRLRRWFKRKLELGAETPCSDFHDAEDDADDIDFGEYDGLVRSSVEMEAGCSTTKTNELRIFVGTWNLAGRPPVESLAVDLDDWLNLRDAADIYVLGFQEIVPLKTSNVIGTEDPTPAARWNALIGRTLNSKYAEYGCGPSSLEIRTLICTTTAASTILTGTDDHKVVFSSCAGHQPSECYVILASKKMVGVFISIWVKKEVLKRYQVSSVKVCAVGCGLMGYLGNKGSVAVSMCIEGASFCFIAAHLASGEKRGDEMRRNSQVADIFRRTLFPPAPLLLELYDDKLQTQLQLPPQTILGHDKIFWFGDLNYRLYLEEYSPAIRQLIKKKDWKALQEFDQLKKERNDGVFQGWREGDIEFPPTYKYSASNCDRYSGGLPNTFGEKQRTPAWCDRILWFGKDVKQLSYVRSESKFSDHRPVSALFSVQIETRPTNNPLLSPLLPSISEAKDEARKTDHNTLLSLLMKEMEESPRQDRRSNT